MQGAGQSGQGMSQLPNVTRNYNYLGRSYWTNDNNFPGSLAEVVRAGAGEGLLEVG